MPYVITEACINTKDKACVDVCPVDCIYEGPEQLYIHPDECIDCGACEPECPWQAIFEEVAVPDVFADDTKLNYAMMEQTGDFAVKKQVKVEHPTPEQVAENKKKWGGG